MEVRAGATGGAAKPAARRLNTDVLIVGGGLSGLSLARALHRDQGTETSFELLEARSRLGGRVLSELDASIGKDDPAAAYDLGPSWFWPGQPRMEAMLKELRIGWYEQYAKGSPVIQGPDGSVQVHPQRYGTMAGSRRIAGGTGALTSALAESLPRERLHTGHRVESVRSLGPSEVLTTARDEEGSVVEVSSKLVVLALPPQVVEATVEFQPPLPSDVTRKMRQIPTWMAAHAKVIAVYDRPFWRQEGKSGDGMSYVGPLGEIHDASPAAGQSGALFGFVSTPAEERREPGFDLAGASVKQLAGMFGPEAGKPRQVLVKDWAADDLTATADNARTAPRGHPAYGCPKQFNDIWDGAVVMASTEVADQDGGFLEGALAASESAHRRIQMRLKRLVDER